MENYYQEKFKNQDYLMQEKEIEIGNLISEINELQS